MLNPTQNAPVNVDSDQAPLSRSLLFGVACGGIILALLFFELCFRLIPTGKAATAISDRPTRLYLPQHSPDRRNFPYTNAKAPNTFRIIVIGDSFTFGAESQFDDNFVGRLGRILNLSSGPMKAEVLNWGIQGFSTAQEQRLVERALSFYEPDLIILQVTLNDPELQPYRVTMKEKRAVLDTFFSNPVLKHSKSLQFVASRIFNSYTRYTHNRYYFDLFENEATWGRFKDASTRITKLGADAKVPVVAVVFPLFTHNFDDSYPFTAIHEKIKKLFTEIQLPELDLLGAYTGLNPIRLQAEPGVDAHPNEIAHRIAADSLYHYLKDSALLPKELGSVKERSRAQREKTWFPAVKLGE